MSQFRESSMPGTSAAGLVALKYRRVKISGAAAADGRYPFDLCGAADMGIGVTDNQQANATGGPVNVLLNNDNKTKIMTANGAISANVTVYAATNGKISATGTVAVGTSLEAASADNDLIEVLPVGIQSSNNPITVHTGDFTPSAHASGTHVMTKGSAAAVTLGAPTATTDDGVVLIFTSATAYAHVITATNLIANGDTTNDTITCAAHAGCSVTLMAYQGIWLVISQNQMTMG